MKKKKYLIPENWEASLEDLILKAQPDSFVKRAYICSPCKDDSPEIVRNNMRAARLYMYIALTSLQINARAPHGFFPVLLCDKIQAERILAMQFCKSLLQTGEQILVCGDRLSSGMKEEITHAAKLGIKISVFNSDLLIEVRKLITQAGADKKLARINKKGSLLGKNTHDILSLDGVI